MAVTVLIYYTGEGNNAVAFAQEMCESGVAEAIRKEDGNLQYDYFFPMEEPQSVLLIDRWENQQALDRHHASPMMAKIIALREKYDLHMRVERYHEDDTGIPANDRAFIRH